MNMFTARPDHIIGNVALASLVSGAGAGLVLGIVAGIASPGGWSILDWLRGIGSTMMIGVFFVFLCGLLFIAPALALLRRIGYGGPFFVYAVSATVCVIALSDSLRFGGVVASFALVASLTFCRYAYQREHDAEFSPIAAVVDDALVEQD